MELALEWELHRKDRRVIRRLGHRALLPPSEIVADGKEGYRRGNKVSPSTVLTHRIYLVDLQVLENL